MASIYMIYLNHDIADIFIILVIDDCFKVLNEFFLILVNKFTYN